MVLILYQESVITNLSLVLKKFGKEEMLIVVGGFPRSGSTWIYGQIQNFWEPEKINIVGRHDKNSRKIIALRKKWARESKAIYLVKASPMPEEIEAFSAQEAKFIFIERDLLDVAGSAKERWGATWENPEKDLLQYIDFVKEEIERYRSFKSRPNVLWLNYETVFENNDVLRERLHSFLNTSKIPTLAEMDSLSKNKKRSSDIGLQIALQFRRIATLTYGRLKARLPKRIAGKRLNLLIKLRPLLPKYDKVSLIGPNHVSSTKGRNGTYMEKLTQQEIESISKIKARFE